VADDQSQVVGSVAQRRARCRYSDRVDAPGVVQACNDAQRQRGRNRSAPFMATDLRRRRFATRWPAGSGRVVAAELMIDGIG
jgi:hypothetical protein